ncbi:MAG: ATP-dependent DNA helicase [Galbitalea sp.]
MISALRIAAALDLRPPTIQQQAVIEADLEPAIVVAGAGSGKTETMANRVVWLLANDRVAIPDILGLTFTRKAAGELTTRIAARVAQLVRSKLTSISPDAFDAATVSTYNAFANSIFRENALLVGRDGESTVLSEASAWQLARNLVVRSTDDRLTELDKSVDDVTGAVLGLSRALGENVADADDVGRFVDDFAGLADLPVGNNRVKGLYASVRDAIAITSTLPPLLRLAVDYRNEKLRRGFVEFSDQVALALEIVDRSEPVVAQYRARYRVVLLDEYQDTSVVQTRLLARLFAGTPVMAVGDPHQSIYGWRGASAANLGRFSLDFTGSPTGAAEFALSTSWRNPTRVLEAANTIAAPLAEKSAVHVHRLEPRTSALEGTLDVSVTDTVLDEAGEIAAWLKTQLAIPSTDGEQRSAAILLRSLKRVRVFSDALTAANVRFRILGIGGLLEEPAVVDLVSALRVIYDPTAGSELIRLLSGARWRIGARDILALSDLAYWLADRDGGQQRLDDEVSRTLRHSLDDGEGRSLVDALDFLASEPPTHRAFRDFSVEGLARMRRAGAQLRYLRSRAGLHLVDLVALVQQELLLDIEVAANESALTGQASLHAFGDQLAGYLAVDGDGTLGGFLSWLREAERRDRMAPRTEAAEPGTVQLLTIHGSKGLEWDVVVVPRMVEGELPSTPRSKKGWLEFGTLPFEFRGDASELPLLAWRGARTQQDFDRAYAAFQDDIVAAHAAEQRRLAYVAVTRTREALLLTGSSWWTQKSPRRPGLFLAELAESGLISTDGFSEFPEPGTENPLATVFSTLTWPLDPLGVRTDRLHAAADAVRSASPDAATEWTDDIDTLLAERALRLEARTTLPAPTRIPASRFKDFVTDPSAVASRLRRPMPEKPYRATRLGTLFHSWVEARSGIAGTGAELDALSTERDEDELPLDHEQLAALQDTFELSPWANRKPLEVEREIHLVLDGHIIVCKIDAIYQDGDRFQVVDWKTGKAPKDAKDLREKQLQLALYRLAYARWRGIDPNLIDAVFYYVADDRVIEPTHLENEDELIARWRRSLGAG